MLVTHFLLCQAVQLLLHDLQLAGQSDKPLPQVLALQGLAWVIFFERVVHMYGPVRWTAPCKRTWTLNTSKPLVHERCPNRAGAGSCLCLMQCEGGFAKYIQLYNPYPALCCQQRSLSLAELFSNGCTVRLARLQEIPCQLHLASASICNYLQASDYLGGHLKCHQHLSVAVQARVLFRSSCILAQSGDECFSLTSVGKSQAAVKIESRAAGSAGHVDVLRPSTFASSSRARSEVCAFGGFSQLRLSNLNDLWDQKSRCGDPVPSPQGCSI